MIEHHIQKETLAKLVHAPESRYADLKPDNIDGNVFTYHLQQLMKAGLIEKTESGSYRLTAAGKQEGIVGNLNKTELRHQAHAILLLCVRSTQGHWLLRKRSVHPMFGRTGFVHGEPKAGESVIKTASERLKQKTGLDVEFSVAGNGFITIYQDDQMESYTEFTLLCGQTTVQDLIETDETGENIWAENPDFTSDEFVPSMKDLATLLDADSLFFTELTYNL